MLAIMKNGAFSLYYGQCEEFPSNYAASLDEINLYIKFQTFCLSVNHQYTFCMLSRG